MPKRVLVVDDDESSRDIVATTLRIVGYEVETANDGQEGYLALRAQHFDGLITDMGMPKADGADMLRLLFADGAARPPTVVLTGFSEDEVRARLGCAAPYLAKPCDAIDLLDAARTYFGAP